MEWVTAYGPNSISADLMFASWIARQVGNKHQYNTPEGINPLRGIFCSRKI